MADAEQRDAAHRVPIETWLDLLENEYLADYLPAGGSAVKVVSGSANALHHLTCRVEELAKQNRMHFAALDAAQPDANGKRPDLHRMDKFFFAAMAGVDWKEWAATQARNFLASRGVLVRPERRLDDLEGIAADNNREPRDLLNQYQAELATPQIRDFGMAVEFRTAVTALGRAQLTPDAVSPTTEEVLEAWLAGKTLPGAQSALKLIQIYEKINQANARFMLASFCRWLPNVERNGLVVVLDFRPYEYKRTPKSQKQAAELRRINEAIARGASSEELAALQAQTEVEPAVFYSEPAYMQMLALIRRFIDEIDWFERFLLVILTTPAYYDDTSKRNYNNYDALQTRIGLEVRDANRANPAAALVHLGDKRP